MIEINGNDISDLSDTDLRSLIGLLCEAEIRAVGLPTAGVTWGGHHNAKDGGIDVRVELANALHKDSFIPRSKTGFQVKKPDMPRSSIINEMRPENELRQIIKDLIAAGGAYIIVSSQGSTSDSALTDRKEAMREALSDYNNATNLKVDFYDRERIAGWVRCYPSLILWVRDKIGRPIQGWRAYGNWSGSPGGIEEEYLLDGSIRLHNGVKPRSNGLSTLDGINELRTLLQHPASSVRLVGLSGVGKTRLLQALFDDRIGERPLNQSQVFYCDISNSPIPDPRSFAERIISLQIPAILAIDNCPPVLHRSLTSVCTAASSLVSLITVEYDVREDQPEETEVFRLEPSSTELIEKVISVRFDYISQVDVRLISEFSGGNARIAIALAKTIQRGENLVELRDSDLFNRLFHQRNETNNLLLKAAEVCSLVYSFSNQTIEGENIELKLLGSLAGMNVREIYENISELKRRDLIQQRGKWRAVLPHAIANKLAQRALENIPLDQIYLTFEKNGTERLLKSFTRRLSYLHESEAALEISRKWLSKDGLLGDIGNLNELGINLLRNIAPINPELTLKALERASTQENAQAFLSRSNTHFTEFTRLLRSLAYDPNLFERSVELLCHFALSENPKENNNSIRKLLESLFYIYLSGTHATSEQRLSIIKKLVESNLENQIELGISLLSASLESWHFGSHYNFEFGARSRDYGSIPADRDDIYRWFKLYIEYSLTLAVSGLSVASKAKKLLAEKFRGLWIKAGMYDELELAANEIWSQGAWKEGWIAVRTTKRFDGKGMPPEIYSRLNDLDIKLEPMTLIERAKLFALSSYTSTLDLDDVFGNEDEEASDSFGRVEIITRSIGQEVSSHEDQDILKELLPAILSEDGARLFSFGQGLADGAFNYEKTWREFCEQLSLIEDSTRNYQVLRGFLNAISEKNANASDAFLDNAVTDTILSRVYPSLQTSVKIDFRGAERLKRSLEFEAAPIWQYTNLAYGRAHDSISDVDLCELLRLILSKPGGIKVSLEILQMRLHGHAEREALSQIMISFGQELLLKYPFSGGGNGESHNDFALANIIKKCLAGESDEDNARILCTHLVEASENNEISYRHYDHVLEALAITQPIAFLDTFLGEEVRITYEVRGLFIEEDRMRPNPMSHINNNIIINWCEINPETRYPRVAFSIKPYYNSSEKENWLEWTPLALKIITNSSNPIEVLNQFKLTFRPMSWSGSRAELMQNRLKLITDLKEHGNSYVANWAFKEETAFEEEIRSEREREIRQEGDRNESFE
ncbi:MAG: hypothetical protein WD469_04025 [Paenibacillaceae bacterium]